MTLVKICGACDHEEARYVLHVEGRRLEICPACKRRAEKIADALDFKPDIEPLPPPGPPS